jgi:nitrite reductase/ring-hydroxylating ferredoxin subunit/uncharacterized membrane protein
MLVAFPSAYLFGSVCADAWARATGRPRWFRTADHLARMGLLTAVAAAIPGLVDYLLAVPPKSSARSRATDHMFANLSAVGLFALAWAGRRGDDGRPAAWSVAAEACGAALVTLGGWLGGTLVYRNQIAVDHRYAEAGRWREQAIALPAAGVGTRGVDVGAVDDLEPGQMKLVDVDGRRIVVARTDQGYSAFDDRCTHKGGSLADGTLAGCVVQCPWHGSQFDARTGAVVHGPAESTVRAYYVEEKDGRVSLHL